MALKCETEVGVKGSRSHFCLEGQGRLHGSRASEPALLRVLMKGKKEARTRQAKEMAQPKGWRLEQMKAFQECLLFPVINHLSPKNDIDSIACQALSWVLMMQQ